MFRTVTSSLFQRHTRMAPHTMDTYYTLDGTPRRRAWWQLHRMPLRWKAALLGCVLAAVGFLLMAPGTPDPAMHERETLVAGLASLAVTVLIAVLTGMVHHGRKLRAGLLLLASALLLEAGLFAAYCATFGLFGL